MKAVAMRRINLSNVVTLVRLGCIPFFAQALVAGSGPMAALLFWLAVATDLADGRLARARGESTRAGALLDHATDALFVVVGLCVLATQGRVTFALPALVAIAFVQYVLDSRWLAGRPLRASGLGRWNGILYFVPLGVVSTREALAWAWPSDAVVGVIAFGLVASTLVSIGDRVMALVRPHVDRPDRKAESPN